MLLPDLFEGLLNAIVCLQINMTTWHLVLTKDQRANVYPAVMADIWGFFKAVLVSVKTTLHAKRLDDIKQCLI